MEHIKQAVELTRREVELQADLDFLNQSYAEARARLEGELAKIRLKQGELIRLYGGTTVTT